jgi:hypothetical protein
VAGAKLTPNPIELETNLIRAAPHFPAANISAAVLVIQIIGRLFHPTITIANPLADASRVTNLRADLPHFGIQALELSNGPALTATPVSLVAIAAINAGLIDREAGDIDARVVSLGGCVRRHSGKSEKRE